MELDKNIEVLVLAIHCILSKHPLLFLQYQKVRLAVIVLVSFFDEASYHPLNEIRFEWQRVVHMFHLAYLLGFVCSDQQTHPTETFGGRFGILFYQTILCLLPLFEDGDDRNNDDDVLHVGFLHAFCGQFRRLPVLIQKTIVKPIQTMLTLEHPLNGVSV